MGRNDLFVVYQDGFPIVVGTAKECAEILGVKEDTVRWYSSPCSVEKERTGKFNRMAVRVKPGDAGD